MMKKIVNLLKKYGFYLATGIVCVGALVAIFLMPNHEGNVKNEANPYAKNKLTDAKDLSESPEEGITIVDEDDLDMTDESVNQPETEENVQLEDESASINNQENTSKVASEETAKEPSEATTNKEVAEQSPEAVTNEEGVESKEVQEETQTFESTTASTNSEPFFAEGDTFVWPVEGSVVVPYTDETTKHWFSESLNQTMRTFGICISAAEGTEVKAVAKGTVREIVDDSSEYLEAGMPYVGKLMVIDHGNGYVSLYGFQGGQVNEQLVGQVVNAGVVLGVVGSPKGAFISMGDNIYLQVTHNDKVVNPLNYLELNNQEVKADGVDLGFTK